MDWHAYSEVCENAMPELAPGEVYEVPNPLRHRNWTDESGTAWRRRGDHSLTPRQVRRLLARDDVLLMHVYGGPVHAHDGRDRGELLADMEAVWSANDPDPLHSFDVGEFRDGAHRVMVLVVESC